MKHRIALASLLAAALVATAIPAGASTASLLSEKRIVDKPLLGGYGHLAYTTGSILYTNIVNEENNSVDLYRYATSTGKKTRALQTDGLDLSDPKISGTKAVYSMIPKGSTEDQSDVYVRDFASSSTGRETRLTSNGSDQLSPDISGDIVVWQDDRNDVNNTGEWDIYAYNLRTGVESVVCTATGSQIQPRISGTKVVYADNRSGDWNIYVTDIKTGKEKRIVSSYGMQQNPVISGSNVIYEDVTGSSTSIRALKLGTDSAGNITSSSTRGLSIGTANQYAPDVSGDRVVWVSDTGSTSALYLYDLAAGSRHKLMSTTSLIDSPQVSGAKVAYIKTDTKGASRIYVASLKVPKVSIVAPTKVKKGSKARITGTFRTSAGTRVSKRIIRIEKSTDKKTWTLVKTVTTSRYGTYSYKSGTIKKVTYYRATYKGGDTYISARSAVKRIGLK